MIEVMSDHLLDDLREAIETYAPAEHHSFSQTRVLQAAQGNNPATTQFNPFQHLVFGAASDPLLALIAGFGTAFDEVNEDVLTPSDSISDYMVTAFYENGLDGESDPVEYAAVLFAPALATPPAPPVNLNASTEGHRAPPQPDSPWRGLIRLDWNKTSDNAKVRVASYAAARVRQPAGDVTPLMTPRLETVPFSQSALRPAPEGQRLQSPYPLAMIATTLPTRLLSTACATVSPTRIGLVCGALGQRRAIKFLNQRRSESPCYQHG